MLSAQSRDTSAVTPGCEACAEWNAPHAPFRIYGNTWYVGTNGLASILITSPQGHVLIDGGLMESAPRIAASIEALGFRIDEVKLLLNSHVHYDHAGGLGELQRRSGASAAATAPAAAVLRSGQVGSDDPQFGIAFATAPLQRVRVVADGETLRVGTTEVTAHLTAGHTPGGTSWTWTSCERARCRAMVYGDSQSAISADGFRFTGSAAARQFEAGFRTLESLACDILLTPHPDASQLWERLARRNGGEPDALVDATACRRYAAGARERLAQRIASER
ncbi:MAG: subclass B3 metallo-beta-lactamase [Gemmatimonadaceae bacterium]|nr:subclass B3 metallo-beta-lactamase [Gemmatimonadaceae bacterium]